MIKYSFEEIWELKNKKISLLTLFEKSLADEYDRNDFQTKQSKYQIIIFEVLSALFLAL